MEICIWPLRICVVLSAASILLSLCHRNIVNLQFFLALIVGKILGACAASKRLQCGEEAAAPEDTNPKRSIGLSRLCPGVLTTMRSSMIILSGLMIVLLVGPSVIRSRSAQVSGKKGFQLGYYNEEYQCSVDSSDSAIPHTAAADKSPTSSLLLTSSSRKPPLRLEARSPKFEQEMMLNAEKTFLYPSRRIRRRRLESKLRPAGYDNDNDDGPTPFFPRSPSGRNGKETYDSEKTQRAASTTGDAQLVFKKAMNRFLTTDDVFLQYKALHDMNTAGDIRALGEKKANNAKKVMMQNEDRQKQALELRKDEGPSKQFLEHKQLVDKAVNAGRLAHNAQSMVSKAFLRTQDEENRRKLLGEYAVASTQKLEQYRRFMEARGKLEQMKNGQGTVGSTKVGIRRLSGMKAD